jgi:hypothetical protein
LAKIYGTAVFVVSAACGGVLERKIGGIERRRADPPVMMPTMSMRSYAGAVGYESALEHDGLALDRIHVNVQTKKAA